MTTLWLGVSVAGTVLAAYVLFNWKLHEFTSNWFQSGKSAPRSPDGAHQDIRLISGGARLHAWWMTPEPSRPAKAALIIFHGNQETLADWSDVLPALRERGIAGFIFDYAGFGESSGRSTIAQLRADGRVALREFLHRAPAGVPRYAMGFSMGGPVLLKSIVDVQDKFAGIMLCATYTSVRDLVPEVMRIPPWLARFLPDFHNNVRSLSRLSRPTLIVHSRDDGVVPIWHARRLAAISSNAALNEIAEAAHTDIFKVVHPAYWRPIWLFMGIE